MQRITEKQLENLVTFINEITGSPLTPYSRDENGNLKGNIGNYHLSHAYGGVNVHKTVNDGGGITCPITHGYVTKRELYNAMHAYIRGLEHTKREAA
jgi:hypothetical protein